MSKTEADVTIYPKLERPIYGHQIMTYREQWRAERDLRIAKRLEPAELAAEAYKAEAEFRAAAGYGYGLKIVKECDRKRSVLQRFATLPHYDEEQS